ncbi:MAG: drug/metabolite transporter (DMT)-like permease [Oceanicoccus sp.]|jgi:drug/metabolite transporter (DMT)-like permease
MQPASLFFSRPLAIALLVMSATLFAGNHIGARFAFDNGAGLLLAVLARSFLSLIFMLSIVKVRKASMLIPAHLVKWQLLLGFLIAAQSLLLYSAITLIPVAMALLLVNTWPMMFIVANWVTGKTKPNTKMFVLLIVILIGLIFVLDIDLSAPVSRNWLLGVGFGIASAVFLATTMWVTQYQLASIAGSVRSSYIMMVVVASMLVAGFLGVVPGGLDLPINATGWAGLSALAVLYGIAVTTLFVLTPKLDMARNSPILNFEPVASLFLGYLFLGQFLNTMQLIGGAIVVLGIMAIGLSRA